MPHVEQIDQIEQLDHYRLLWKSLHGQTRDATFFQTLEWLQAYWRHFGHDKQLRTLIVYAAARPIGIVPLVVLREPTRVGGLRVLTYPLHDWGSFFGPIGRDTTATLTVAMRYLQSSRRDWDLLDLRWINESLDRGRTRGALQQAGFQGRAATWKKIPVVEMHGRWDDYLAARSPKFRAAITRGLRRVDDGGELTYLRYRPQGSAFADDDPRWDLYDTCVDLAQRSWQGGSPTGTTLSHAAVQPYFRDTHLAAVRAGMLDLNLILADDVPIAFGYNYHHQGHVSGVRIGFDPRWAKVGPGRLLLAKTLQDGFARGDRLLDLGPGSLDAKRPWQTRVLCSRRATHYPLASPRTQLLRLKHWATDRRTSRQAAS